MPAGKRTTHSIAHELNNCLGFYSNTIGLQTSMDTCRFVSLSSTRILSWWGLHFLLPHLQILPTHLSRAVVGEWPKFEYQYHTPGSPQPWWNPGCNLVARKRSPVSAWVVVFLESDWGLRVTELPWQCSQVENTRRNGGLKTEFGW